MSSAGGGSAPPRSSVVPGFVRRLAGERAVPRGRKVAGILADQNGHPIGPTLANGSDQQQADNAATLREDGNWRELDVALSHV